MYKLGVDIGEPFKIGLIYVSNDQLVWWGQHRLSSREEFIEVFSTFATHFGLERWLDLSVFQFLPVNSPEESVFPDVSFTFEAAAKALCGMFSH